MQEFVLFDTYKTIVKNAKDISDYMAESIRNIYGIIVKIKLSEYEGMTSKHIVKDVLTKHGMEEKEIDARLDRIMEDLPYSYYNVAWSDTLEIVPGAKELLNEIEKNNVLIGIATGEAERVAKMRLEKVKLSQYFKFGAYGENGIDMEEIVEAAVNNASELGMDKSKGILIASSPVSISAARAAGIRSIGISTGNSTQESLKEAGAEIVMGNLRERSKIVRLILS